MSACVCARVCASVRVRAHVRVYVHVCACVFVCLCVRVFVFVYGDLVVLECGSRGARVVCRVDS